jgi:hypothetical protein
MFLKKDKFVGAFDVSKLNQDDINHLNMSKSTMRLKQ